MIGVDWGTSSLRAYRLDAAGQVIERIATQGGILSVTDGDFAGALRSAIAPWLADGERRVLLSGMIGSRQGWIEAPYLPCPAGAADIAGALVRVAFDGADALLVPGLSDADAAGTPEVMRGEETQIIGVLATTAEATACLPGSHAKWARVLQGRITSFRTYFSGEAFAAMRNATILGRMMNDAPNDALAFERGLARAEDPGHLLNHLFGVRSLGLFNRLGADGLDRFPCNRRRGERYDNDGGNEKRQCRQFQTRAINDAGCPNRCIGAGIKAQGEGGNAFLIETGEGYRACRLPLNAKSTKTRRG